MQFHTFFGINFIKSSYSECLREIESRLREKKKTLIVTPNPEILYDAHSDKMLATILVSSNIAIPDGVGIFVGYQIMDSKLPRWVKYGLLPFWCLRAIVHSKKFSQKYWERITGSRLTPDILGIAVRNGIDVTIIDPVVHWDSEGDILKRASQENMQSIIKSQYPWIQCSIVVADSIDINTALNPIILATHGNKKQEKIVAEILASRREVLLWIGIWSSIDLLTGFRRPAPPFFRRFGWEWLYRLYKNPKKHSKRMIRVFRFLELCLHS